MEGLCRTQWGAGLWSPAGCPTPQLYHSPTGRPSKCQVPSVSLTLLTWKMGPRATFPDGSSWCFPGAPTSQ